MTPLQSRRAFVRERNGVLEGSSANSAGASQPNPAEGFIRQQLARRGYKMMRRRPPGHADTRFWLMFSEPLTLAQLNDFVIKLDGVKP